MAGYPRQSGDKDIEEKEAELASIESQKHTAQTEMLDIAANKKRLAQELEDGKKKNEEEVAAHLATLKEEERVLNKSIASKKDEENKLEKENKDTRAFNDALKKSGQSLKEYIENKETEKKVLDKNFSDLSAQVANIQKKIVTLTAEHSNEEKKKIPLETHLRNLQVSIGEKQKTHDLLAANIVAHTKTLEPLSIAKESLEKEIPVLKKILMDMKIEEDASKNRLQEIEEKHTVHSDAMAEESKMIDEKMGNLARLDEKVERNLELFKEAKKTFSTEELARMKIAS